MRTVALSHAGAAFNLHEIDKDWQPDVRSLLQECRVHVPCPWHVSRGAPLRTIVPAGDDALISLLAVAMERVSFTAQMRKAALRYFASRKQNSPEVLSTLRKMPLFLRSMPYQSESHLRGSGQPSAESK